LGQYRDGKGEDQDRPGKPACPIINRTPANTKPNTRTIDYERIAKQNGLAFNIHKKREQGIMKKHIIHQPNYHRLLNEYKADLETLGYGGSSKKIYPRCLQEFLYRLEQQQINSIRKIQQGHITAHHAYLRQRPKLSGAGALGDSTIGHHLFAVRTFFTYLERTGQLKENPMSALTFAGPVKEERVILSIEEIKALYEAATTLRDKAALGLFYGCGLRRSEAVTLNINDIHFKTQLLYVREGKGRKRRVIPMGLKITEDLKNYYLHERNSYINIKENQNEEAFILNNAGTRMLGGGYDKVLKNLLEKSAVSHLKGLVSLHILRHSIASHLLENGVKIAYVRDFLGHSCLNTTQVYTHIKQSQLKQLI
jgi:integrase/recombinase XerD